MPRPVDASDLIALARRMQNGADPHETPLILRSEDIARLGTEDAARFWELVQIARLRSLDS